MQTVTVTVVNEYWNKSETKNFRVPAFATNEQIIKVVKKWYASRTALSAYDMRWVNVIAINGKETN